MPAVYASSSLMALSASSREFIEMLAFIYLQHHREADAAVLLELLAQSTGEIRLKGAAALAQLRANHAEKALRTIESLPLRHQLTPEFQLLRAQSLYALDRHPESAAAMQAFVTARLAFRREEPPTVEDIKKPSKKANTNANLKPTSVGRAS